MTQHGRIRRVLCIAVCCMVILSLSALPAKATITRASDYISNYYVQVLPNRNGEIVITAFISGVQQMDIIGIKTIDLYEDAGRGFKLVKSFSHTDSEYSNFMASTTDEHNTTVRYNGIAGRRYYASVSFYAKNSRGDDTKVFTTQSVVAQ